MAVLLSQFGLNCACFAVGPTVEQLTGEEHKVLSQSDCSFQGAGTVHLLDPDCTGSCISSCGVVFKFVFCVGFFLNSLLVSKFLEAGRVGRQDSLQFLLCGQLFNPEVKQVFLAAPLHSFP